MQKYKNRDKETGQNKNRIQFKFNNTNPIHQTNVNRIITVTTNGVQCESSVKSIRENSIKVNDHLPIRLCMIGLENINFIILFLESTNTS